MKIKKLTGSASDVENVPTEQQSPTETKPEPKTTPENSPAWTFIKGKAVTAGSYAASTAGNAMWSLVTATASKTSQVAKWCLGLSNLQEAWDLMWGKTIPKKIPLLPKIIPEEGEITQDIEINAQEELNMFERISAASKQVAIAGFKAAPIWAYGVVADNPSKGLAEVVTDIPLLIYRGQKGIVSTLFKGVTSIVPIIVDRVVVPAGSLLWHAAGKVSNIASLAFGTSTAALHKVSNTIGSEYFDVGSLAVGAYLAKSAWDDMMSVPNLPELKVSYQPQSSEDGKQETAEGNFRIKKGDSWIWHKIKKLPLAGVKLAASVVLCSTLWNKVKLS